VEERLLGGYEGFKGGVMVPASSLRSSVKLLSLYRFEMGPIRPPSEGGSYSLLVRVTRNCPWSKCTFCYGTPYNRERFQVRLVGEVKADIDAVKLMCDELKMLSKMLGYSGEVNEGLASTLLVEAPELTLNPCFVTVFNWLSSGAKTVFLQDADSLIMRTEQLVEVVKYLKTVFPRLERITSYARAKTLARKPFEELKALRRAGLVRLHVGLETGDDELLRMVNKGVTSEEQVEAGRKTVEAGFELSEYVMPGLGGRDRWREHAENTAKVLNRINPHYVRMRTLVPRPGTPLYEDYVKGRFKLLSPHEILREIKALIERLDVESRVCFDHFCNPSYRVKGGFVAPLFRQGYEGYKLPEEKDEILRAVDFGLSMEESRFVRVEELINMPL